VARRLALLTVLLEEEDHSRDSQGDGYDGHDEAAKEQPESQTFIVHGSDLREESTGWQRSAAVTTLARG
jgi:hypothetical protein